MRKSVFPFLYENNYLPMFSFLTIFLLVEIRKHGRRGKRGVELGHSFWVRLSSRAYPRTQPTWRSSTSRSPRGSRPVRCDLVMDTSQRCCLDDTPAGSFLRGSWIPPFHTFCRYDCTRPYVSKNTPSMTPPVFSWRWWTCFTG